MFLTKQIKKGFLILQNATIGKEQIRFPTSIASIIFDVQILQPF